MIRKLVCLGLLLGAIAPSFAAAAVPNTAEALLTARSGSEVTGKFYFKEEQGKVIVTGSVEGLTPGKHGVHIHETGDCTADDASSAGPHFDPTGEQHGAPGTNPHHAGDLGNIVADEKGEAKVDIVIQGAKFSLKGANSILGRSIIVHKGEDDLKTQPSGGSGDRIACGFIELSED